MRRLVGAVTVAVALFAAGGTGAEGARFTTHLDPLAAALAVRSADPALPKKHAKLFGKALKTLGKDTSSLYADVVAASKVIPGLEKKAASDTAVLSAATLGVDGLLATVSVEFAEAGAAADALEGAKKDPLLKISRVLRTTGGRLLRATSGTTLTSRLRFLLPAAKGVTQVQVLIAKAGGSDPDPDPAACGPTTEFDAWIRAQLRDVGDDESFLADVTDFRGMYAFDAGTILALAGPQMGFPGATEVLDLRAYDCTEKSCIQFVVPFPPVAGTTYTEMNGGSGGYQADYDGFTEVYPRGNRITVDTFDAGTETVTGTFAFGGVLNGRFTVRGLRAPVPFVPPGPPGPPAKPER